MHPAQRTHRVPRHYAAQMGAHAVDGKALNLVALGHNQVGGIALSEHGKGEAAAGEQMCRLAGGEQLSQRLQLRTALSGGAV